MSQVGPQAPHVLALVKWHNAQCVEWVTVEGVVPVASEEARSMYDAERDTYYAHAKWIRAESKAAVTRAVHEYTTRSLHAPMKYKS